MLTFSQSISARKADGRCSDAWTRAFCRSNEVCRFPNRADPAATIRFDGTSTGCGVEIRRGLDRTSESPLESIGVDTWGCDYALLDERGDLLENPYHYRDTRTDGVMEAVWQRVPRERDLRDHRHSVSDVQHAVSALRRVPLHAAVIDAAAAFGTIPDLLNYWLTGELRAEYTMATTTQFVDAQTRTWATDLLDDLDIPTRLLPPLVEPGTALGDYEARRVRRARRHTRRRARRVTTPARLSRPFWPAARRVHQLGHVVAARHRAAGAGDHCRSRATSTSRMKAASCGTTRLLKNIGGLWLLQACRRSWAARGRSFGYEALLAAASDEPHAFQSLVDPDHRGFFQAARHGDGDRRLLPADGSAGARRPPAFTRANPRKPRFQVSACPRIARGLTGTRFEEIRIVGGGSRNRLLNQFTADATGRTVVAGPVEATALGNIAMQMLATGAVSSLMEARRIIASSFPTERFEPRNVERWNAHTRASWNTSKRRLRRSAATPRRSADATKVDLEQVAQVHL